MTDLTVKELQQKRTELEQELSAIMQDKLSQFSSGTGVSIDNVYVYGHDVTELQDEAKRYVYTVSVDLDI